MLLASRIASMLDVISNVAGTIIGAALAAPIERACAIASARIRQTGLMERRSRYALAVLLAVIVLGAWYPFDVTLDISTLSERTRAVRRDPWLLPATSQLLMQAARYCVLTATLASGLVKLEKWAAPAAMVVTVSIALLVDLGQVGMGSQPIGLAAFASQAAGAFAGAGAALFVALVRGSPYAAA